MPWVIIPSGKGFVITGVDASGTNYGKPGYFNLIMTVIFLFFHFIPRVWAKRGNLLVVAMNVAWSFRNYLVLPLCQGGQCPDKQIGLHLQLVASILMLAAALFPDMKLPRKEAKNQ
jgi:hypothetical protein